MSPLHRDVHPVQPIAFRRARGGRNRRPAGLPRASHGQGARGFTLVEMMVVLAIVGTMLTIAFRPLTLQRNRANARSARVMVSQGLATARSAAIARGCVSVLHLNVTGIPNGKMWVTSCKAITVGRVTAALDTLGRIDTLSAHFGVTVTGTTDSVRYDSRGFSVNFASAAYAFTGGTGARDTLTVNNMGRVGQ
jgi:prepilin-type N-terminal cleavage/methylation domain-containing protein